MHFLVNLAVHILAVAATAALLPGVGIDTLWTLILVTIVLGVLNTVIKPLLNLLTLPLNILSLGLFSLIVNGFLIWVITRIVPGFTVANFWWAVAFSVVISLVGWFLHLISKEV